MNITRNLKKYVIFNKSIRSYSISNLIKTEIKRHGEINIGYVILSDYVKLNALTVEMGQQFKVAINEMTEASKNQDIRGCIITGEGSYYEFSYIYECLCFILEIY